jgi:omega-6 fatty acid desaturase (delta-12 desaturase)
MVAAFYIGPLLVVNAWLVIYTWLHHTDTDVPHFSDSEFTHTRGAFLSIDRPYGKLINFLHHSIGSTHVAHHLAPLIPHYHAGKATISIKKSFPKVYLYNPTPIHKALWHIATNCIAVRKEEGSGRYLWKQPWST